MAKKDFKSLTTDLSQLASSMPTQHVAQESTNPKANAKGEGTSKKKKTPAPTEVMVQCNIEMRKSLKKDLTRLALDADMTIQSFVLDALRAKGLDVTDNDVVDRRRAKG